MSSADGLSQSAPHFAPEHHSRRPLNWSRALPQPSSPTFIRAATLADVRELMRRLPIDRRLRSTLRQIAADGDSLWCERRHIVDRSSFPGGPNFAADLFQRKFHCMH
jgi:hypothetical protein